jgi:TonB-linked SusC/RagA family outer membrane protein
MKKNILFMALAVLCIFFKSRAQNILNQIRPISGKITDEQGNGLPGATVKIQGSTVGTITDNEGNFSLSKAPSTGTLQVSFIGYPGVEVPYTFSTKLPITIHLKSNSNPLNEVQVVGYGSTTKRLNTGAVATVSAQSIAEQPVTNVLSALSGQAAGVFVQTANGLPGGNINIQIRGQGSITAGNNPLYVIDGVPFNATVGSLSSLSILSTGAINGQISPFNTLNPSDIESISILKDADATAIYGSRGSNGVVLITTKKGKEGRTRASVNISDGITEATNIPRLLNSAQYLQMQQAAYANDGITPSADPNSNSYAPQLTTWLNATQTNWAKYLLGGTGHFTNAEADISGGNNGTTFTVSGNYHSEKAYLPGDNQYDRDGIYANIQHSSEDGRFWVQFSHSLTLDDNKLVNPSGGISYDMLLPTDYPTYDQTGNYNFYFGDNPLAEIYATSQAKTTNLVDNLLLRYSIVKDLEFKVSAGYNLIQVDQTQIFPTVSLYPGTPNYTNFGRNSNHSYIIEPQLTYNVKLTHSTLNLLAGGTYQNTIFQGETITASDFTNEELMQNLASAGSYVTANNYTQYKYVSVFGRATYNIADKYIVNATIRRDGSSRFGPGRQFGNFGSIGGAWLWGDENFIKTNLPFISFGKLRASYGLTGNDQITDYQYLSTYGNSGYVYENIPGLRPTRIANPDFHWETTKKLDFGLDVGLLKSNILLTVDHYRDLTDDQLVNYNIPSSSGFTSYVANLPATVKNSGWEFSLNTKNIKTTNFSWTTAFNLTLPKNELVSFPNLSSSSYANTLVIGQDISRIYGYQFDGLNNEGLALYTSKNGVPTNTPNSATDAFYTVGKKSPDLYGGITNTIVFHNWSFEIMGQFVRQHALGNLMFTPGGEGYNNYAITDNYWTSTHTNTNIPKPSTYNDFSYYQSSANYFNTSYFRIKNVELSYKLPQAWLTRMAIEQARIFIQGENILSFWNKNEPFLDPETGTFGGTANGLPPTKAFIIGIQTTF